MRPNLRCLALPVREGVRLSMFPSFPFYPAPTTSPTQPTQRVRWGSCTPRTLAVPDRCHVPTGLMGDERTACLIAGALRLARPPLVLFLGA